MSTSEKTIQITVSPEGSVSIKTSGFTGGSCRAATRDIERALGVSGRESLTAEYFQNDPQAHRLRNTQQ